MGEFIKPRKVSKDELKVCGQCKNEGLKTSFRFVKTSDKRIVELCFNCQQ